MTRTDALQLLPAMNTEGQTVYLYHLDNTDKVVAWNPAYTPGISSPEGEWSWGYIVEGQCVDHDADTLPLRRPFRYQAEMFCGSFHSALHKLGLITDAEWRQVRGW